MPNAKDAEVRESFTLIGPTGSGKTAQFLTMPGRKFAYIFDPFAMATLRGYDLEYEEFFPEEGDLDPYPRSIRKDKRVLSDRPGDMAEPTLYLRWLEDLNRRYDDGFFDGIDSLLVDSGTLLARALYQRIFYLQEKKGREDERTDYKIAGEKFTEAFWQLTTLPCNLMITMHHELRKDDTSSKTFNRMTIPGASRLMTPRLVSNVWATSIEEKDGKGKYLVQTRPNRENPTIRTSMAFSRLDLFHDMTIKDLTAPEEYGIGAILKNGG
jgi:hypothetical protein